MRGYFYHLHPDYVPSKYQFAYFRVNNPDSPKAMDPALQGAWARSAGLFRGVYQRPKITADCTVAENVSYAQQHMVAIGGESALSAFPFMFCAEYNMDIMEVQLYLELLQNILPKDAPKPLMYISSQRWKDLQGGPDAMNIAANIASVTNVCLSDWTAVNVYTMDPPLTIKAWEYLKGDLQYSPVGSFDSVPRQTIPDDDNNQDDPPAQTGDFTVDLHITGTIKKI
jgi:hypothetical protein